MFFVALDKVNPVHPDAWPDLMGSDGHHQQLGIGIGVGSGNGIDTATNANANANANEPANDHGIGVGIGMPDAAAAADTESQATTGGSSLWELHDDDGDEEEDEDEHLALESKQITITHGSVGAGGCSTGGGGAPRMPVLDQDDRVSEAEQREAMKWQMRGRVSYWIRRLLQWCLVFVTSITSFSTTPFALYVVVVVFLLSLLSDAPDCNALANSWAIPNPNSECETLLLSTNIPNPSVKHECMSRTKCKCQNLNAKCLFRLPNAHTNKCSRMPYAFFPMLQCQMHQIPTNANCSP